MLFRSMVLYGKLGMSRKLERGGVVLTAVVLAFDRTGEFSLDFDFDRSPFDSALGYELDINGTGFNVSK